MTVRYGKLRRPPSQHTASSHTVDLEDRSTGLRTGERCSSFLDSACVDRAVAWPDRNGLRGFEAAAHFLTPYPRL